jgi:hypothetical protein
VTTQVNGFGQERRSVVNHAVEDERGLFFVRVVAQHRSRCLTADRVDTSGDAGLDRGPHVRVDLVEHAGAALGHDGGQQQHVPDPFGRQRHHSWHRDSAEGMTDQDDVGEVAPHDVDDHCLSTVLQGDCPEVDPGPATPARQVDGECLVPE